MINTTNVIMILIILAIIMYFVWKQLSADKHEGENILKYKYKGYTIYLNEHTQYTRIYTRKGKLVRSTYLSDMGTIKSYIDRL